MRTGRADPEALATAVATLHTAEAPKQPVLILGDVLRGAERTAENLIGLGQQ